MTICYDLDGTLFTGGDALDRDPGAWSDPGRLAEAIRPIREACDLVTALYQAGHTPAVCYVTGRPETVRQVTELQLVEAQLPEAQLAMQPSWQGWEAFTDRKEDALRDFDASIYVADTRHDRLAADRAGCLFIPAQVFHRLAGV